MEHFSEERWVDFARGVIETETNNGMKAHMLTCVECKTSHERWNRITKLAGAEAAYEPPPNLVRLVKLGLRDKAAQQPQKWTLASIIFDSFTQPLPAGVRSAGAGAGAVRVWQMVTEAEGLSVDLRFSHRPQSKAQLVGQVFDKQAIRPLQQSAIVELSTDDNLLIATSIVSPLGEFHIEFELKDQLSLSIKAAGRNTVRIPLANVRQT